MGVLLQEPCLNAQGSGHTPQKVLKGKYAGARNNVDPKVNSSTKTADGLKRRAVKVATVTSAVPTAMVPKNFLLLRFLLLVLALLPQTEEGEHRGAMQQTPGFSGLFHLWGYK